MCIRDSPITKRLSYSISGIGVKVKLDYLKSDKTLLDSIDIILNRCDNTGEKIIYLKNDGQVYDTVNLTSSLPGVFVVQPTNIVLAPGEEVGIKIKALLNSPIEFYSKINITSQPCYLNKEINIHALYETSLIGINPVSYTHLRAHETVLDLVCRLLLEKKKNPTLQNPTR